MDEITAACIVPGLAAKSYAGLPIDIMNASIGYIRQQFPDYLLDDFVDELEDNEDLVISVTVSKRPHE
jgi:hypothetical protein